MIVQLNAGAARANMDSLFAWDALIHRDTPITAGELLGLLEVINRQNPDAPIPVEQARTAFKVFWQAQLDDIEAAR